jgi:hypothetical protein
MTLQWHKAVTKHLLVETLPSDKMMNHHFRAQSIDFLDTVTPWLTVPDKAFAQSMCGPWADKMVEARKEVMAEAVDMAQSVAEVERVIYFFYPTFDTMSYTGEFHTRDKLDWNKIAAPAREAAARTIEAGVMRAWLNPEYKMARHRLGREFADMNRELKGL